MPPQPTVDPIPAPENTATRTYSHAMVQARARLDGMARPTLQRLLYALWTDRSATAAVPRLALSQALVHLRRTGTQRYDVHDHLLVTAAETPLRDPLALRQVQRCAIAPGTQVTVLGENHPGTVMAVVIGHDPHERYPTP